MTSSLLSLRAARLSDRGLLGCVQSPVGPLSRLTHVVLYACCHMILGQIKFSFPDYGLRTRRCKELAQSSHEILKGIELSFDLVKAGIRHRACTEDPQRRC